MVPRELWRSEALRVVHWLRPCTHRRVMQGLQPSTTLRISDLHNARLTILNPFDKNIYYSRSHVFAHKKQLCVIHKLWSVVRFNG